MKDNFKTIIRKYQNLTGKTLTNETKKLNLVHEDMVKRGLFQYGYRSFMYKYREHFKNESPEKALKRFDSKSVAAKPLVKQTPTIRDEQKDITSIEVKKPLNFKTLLFIITVIVAIITILLLR